MKRPPEPFATPVVIDHLRAEVARLRAERDAAVAEVDTLRGVCARMQERFDWMWYMLTRKYPNGPPPEGHAGRDTLPGFRPVTLTREQADQLRDLEKARDPEDHA